MAKFLIKVQSTSDIITNSSSEVFLCHNDTRMTMGQLKEFIFEYNRSHQFKGNWSDWQRMSEDEKANYDTSGGMGGFLEVYSYKDCVEEKDSYWVSIMNKQPNPKNCLIIDTDWCHRATIDWIRKNLNAELLE